MYVCNSLLTCQLCLEYEQDSSRQSPTSRSSPHRERLLLMLIKRGFFLSPNLASKLQAKAISIQLRCSHKILWYFPIYNGMTLQEESGSVLTHRGMEHLLSASMKLNFLAEKMQEKSKNKFISIQYKSYITKNILLHLEKNRNVKKTYILSVGYFVWNVSSFAWLAELRIENSGRFLQWLEM